ncbi:hypothetical protein NMG60_11016394 [Bertholletia excelsa]
MLRCWSRYRSCLRLSLRRALSSSASSSSRNPGNSAEYPNAFKNSQQVPPPVSTIVQHSGSLSPLPSFFSRSSIFVLSATLVSATVASYALLYYDFKPDQKLRHVYADVEHAIDRSNQSFGRMVDRMKQTGVAASVLWKSLRSVLSSANHEVRSGFEFRVAAFLADIAAANASRRTAIVGAGNGAVVDWLLETVAASGDNCGTQAEAARALAYLIADPNVSEAVLGRPHAVPYLLRSIFLSQPRRSKKQSRHALFDVSDSLKGRSMLVAAIMDIITSNCDSLGKLPLRPALSGNAEMGDIIAAIEVIEEGGMHLDSAHESDEGDNGDQGIKGIGIKILGGTTDLGLSRTGVLRELDLPNTSEFDPTNNKLQNLLFNKVIYNSPDQPNMTSAVVPGLWDDLLCQHVAVPFAAWALANWAMSSHTNRSRIQELDQDGHAVLTALTTAERSVKWHGSLLARLLLEDCSLPLNDSVPDWSFSLLSDVHQASKAGDFPLAQVALSAFLVSIKRSPAAQEVVVKKGLHLMRETAKQTQNHMSVQESLAKALELLSMRDIHMCLEESQRWSGVLLDWVFQRSSSESMRLSAIKILSRIFDDYGPSSIPISQGWLALLLNDTLGFSKTKSTKGNNHLKTHKVKTQIDQSNIVYGQQVAIQLADAVVNLAANQLGIVNDSGETLHLADFLNLEPFSGPFKNLKDSLRKCDAADSALATLKGIKALTELCADDAFCQNRITDFGILCLLRRFLLQDDYEQLAATEAYDASRTQEMQDQVSDVSAETSAVAANDPSSVRVPPTAHIRRHAARLLTILSALPKVKKLIASDTDWCTWLEDCANGKIPGCNDVKIQSYARATLLNIFCDDQIGRNTSDDNISNGGFQTQNRKCPHYADMIFLINPELPHWKCMDKGLDTDGSTQTNNPNSTDDDSLSTHIDETQSCSRSEVPLMDVVFVHGLRGGPFKTWRLGDDKSSTQSGLVEKIDEEAGKQGTFWPGEWLPDDFPHARLFSLKYKTNLTQWSGATLPLQEVSSMLLEKLVAAGIGSRPVVFVTHSLGGLVVKQMLHQAKSENKNDLVNNIIGVVFYSCPHFGSKLADMPWRMGLVLRPAPTIGELRSGSPRLVELNDFVRHLHKKGLEVLSFCETKVTPIVEGYGGWAFRMEIVSIESAYPGFGELVVLESTDHINSCKPLSRNDPSYRETLEFLKKLKAQLR